MFSELLDWLSNGINITFIEKSRYMLFVEGFQNTLIIALFATIIGVAIGVVVAILKVYCLQSGNLKPVNKLLGVYITVFRGTPIVVQLLIWYFVILRAFDVSGVLAAIIAFGLNSGAYVSEIVRGGIMGVDVGQTEAGRSLGLTTGITMRYIVLPQAIKSVLPALGNEFIALLKETSVVGYIAVLDFTRAGNQIRAATYEPFFSLIFVAIVYLLLVVGISKILSIVERRLRKSDSR